jgi:hypothetical protein
MATVMEIMKSKLRASVKAYNKIKTDLDATPEDEQTPDMFDKERLYRGIVRGQVMMYIAFSNPQYHNDKDMVTQHEVRLGVVGAKTNRNPPPVSPRFIETDA